MLVPKQAIDSRTIACFGTSIQRYKLLVLVQAYNDNKETLDGKFSQGLVIFSAINFKLNKI